MASAHSHESFIQPTDAADGEETGPAAAGPAVQEEQEENHVSVNDGMHLYGAFFLLNSTPGGAGVSASLRCHIYFDLKKQA